MNIYKLNNFETLAFSILSFVCTKVAFRMSSSSTLHTHVDFVIRDTIANTCDKAYIRSMSHPTSILEFVRFSVLYYHHVTRPTRRIITYKQNNSNYLEYLVWFGRTIWFYDSKIYPKYFCRRFEWACRLIIFMLIKRHYWFDV